jgi:hypothetical protein
MWKLRKQKYSSVTVKQIVIFLSCIYFESKD